jgi:hypothetical protein
MHADLLMHSDSESGWAKAADTIGSVGSVATKAVDIGANVTKTVAETAMNTDWGRMLMGGGLAIGGAMLFGKGTLGTVAGAAAMLGGGYMLFKELRDSGKLSAFGIEPKAPETPDPVEVDVISSEPVDEGKDGTFVADEAVDYSVPGADSVRGKAADQGFAYA